MTVAGEIIHSYIFTPRQRVLWAVVGIGLLILAYGVYLVHSRLGEGWGKDILFMALFLLVVIGLFAPVRAVFDVERIYRLNDATITCEVRGLFVSKEIVLSLSSIKELKVVRQNREDSRDTYCVRMITASGTLMDFSSQETREEAEALMARIEAALKEN
jgi:hypothetical protein